MKECCDTCALKYKAHETDYRKLLTDEPIDRELDGFICMAFAIEKVANLMLGLDPSTGHCEMWTPKQYGDYPIIEKKHGCHDCRHDEEDWRSDYCDGCVSGTEKPSKWEAQTDCAWK